MFQINTRHLLRNAMAGSLLSFTLLFSAQVVAEIPERLNNMMVGVRIADLSITSLAKNVFPEFGKVSELIEDNRGQFLRHQAKVIHNIFLTERPVINGKQVTLKLTAFIQDRSFTGFERFQVSYQRIKRDKFKDVSTRHLESINLADTFFRADVSLINRKVVLRDRSHGISMVFPLGVGAIDEMVRNTGKYELLTQTIANGKIEKKRLIQSRKRPSYYKGLPFIRITGGDDKVTAIGFHIRQNKKELQRSFVSHGCLRTRKADLLAFYNLAEYGPQDSIPLNISYRIQDNEGANLDHPWGKINGRYKTVVNVGSPDAPRCRRKKEFFWFQKVPALVLIGTVHRPVPLEMFNDDQNYIEYPLRKCLTKKQDSMLNKVREDMEKGLISAEEERITAEKIINNKML
ncbi:MAG: L,D-transpeptidase [Bdellovibrionales bacterium]|jgi:hypothetical protein|nr:L,D-transpeptidase [Bdellovibrionales bacterium]MBT3524834.1 L,D-transpeptidase [Bdellovibrionales bacterium]MBT7669210.1 L,D-transpeptidase [Bdellovibrionales bacterium]MBT7768022.1 L,D-transpeptidase [Bdellovibrionales bacterium]